MRTLFAALHNSRGPGKTPAAVKAFDEVLADAGMRAHIVHKISTGGSVRESLDNPGRDSVVNLGVQRRARILPKTTKERRIVDHALKIQRKRMHEKTEIRFAV